MSVAAPRDESARNGGYRPRIASIRAQSDVVEPVQGAKSIKHRSKGAVLAGFQLAQDFDVHPNQIKQWRDQLLEGATGVFGEAPKKDAEPAVDVKTLHAKIGELTLEKDFLSGALGKAGLLARARR